MRLWVFSDLHLNNPESGFYQAFLKCLDEPANANDTVVFAGDIFDVFVGNSAYFSQKHAAFFNQVSTLSSRQVKLFYLEGNHDFHLEKSFRNCSVQFLDDEMTLKVSTHQGDRLIYIAHGDLVDHDDHSYLRLRKFLRSSPARNLIAFLPGRLLEKIGTGWSRPHRQKLQDLPESWPEDQRLRLRRIYRGFAEKKKAEGVDYILLGHCHDLDEIKPFYFNMGFPPVHGTYLFYDSLEDCVTRKSLRK